MIDSESHGLSKLWEFRTNIDGESPEELQHPPKEISRGSAAHTSQVRARRYPSVMFG